MLLLDCNFGLRRLDHWNGGQFFPSPQTAATESRCCPGKHSQNAINCAGWAWAKWLQIGCKPSSRAKTEKESVILLALCVMYTGQKRGAYSLVSLCLLWRLACSECRRTRSCWPLTASLHRVWISCLTVRYSKNALSLSKFHFCL